MDEFCTLVARTLLEVTVDFQCRLVVLPIGELCPHPSYIRHQLSASASHLSALAV